MRQLTTAGLLVLAGIAVAAPPPKDAPKKDPPSIVGEWVMETAGDPMRLVLTEDGKYLKSRGKTVFTTQTYVVDTKKSPAEIDLSHPGLGVTRRGIWKVEGDTLTVCVGLGAGSGRPAQFEKSADPPVSLSTYTRVKPKD